ncbi:solute carrier family 45 member 3 [Sardina pilchardus]|uniref:solute carrier family 45 member 3 n=1 Tax=Sardina pilchardus TaxID=27697 RepID=UPI002E145BA5
MRSHLCLLLLVNMMTCGLEVCLAVGTIYIPPLLLEAGLEERYMTMVLGVGPVLGLIFVPLIGSASDNWKGRFGRRRPFIWALSVGVLLSLVLIPHATSLASLLALRRPRWLEVGLLVLGIVLLQFCGQACFTPLEALVSDLFPGEQESRSAFTAFSLLLSLGGCLGYLLPAVDWSAGVAALYLGRQEAFIYMLLTLIFLACMLSTAMIAEESTAGAEESGGVRKKRRLHRCCSWLMPLRLCGAAARLLAMLPQSYQMYQGMPRVLRRLFLADFCSWMALESFLLFYTDFVGERLYHGQPSAVPGSKRRLLYEEGVRMASLGLFLQCLMAVCCSLLMERLLARVGPKALLLCSVGMLTFSTAVMTLSHSTVLVTAMAAATGFTFCTLQVLPYTLICLYHSNKQVFFPSTVRKPVNTSKDTSFTQNGLLGEVASLEETCASACLLPQKETCSSACIVPLPNPELELPSSSRGMCLDLALLDSAYLLSQVVPSLLMGSLVQFTHNVSAYMASSCALSLLAVWLSSRIIFDRKDMELLQ